MLVCLFFICQPETLKAQERQIITGKIIVDSISREGIHVINLTSEIGTTTDKNGNFKIPVNLKDTLYFSSLQFENRNYVLQTEDLRRLYIEVRLEKKFNELEEVNIDNIKLSGYLDNDLSKIKFFDREKHHIPYPEKNISQTERRIFTATTGPGGQKLTVFSILSGTIPFDPIINGISGKTKYLKEL
ncbi:hypothetical protein DHD80_07680 [Gramella sp. AN32]|nr:hypothetical protein [Gramella sp. AN32]